MQIKWVSVMMLCVCASLVQAASGTKATTHGKFLGAAQTEMPAWFTDSFLDLSEDVAEAAEAKKRVMVFFHQDGCPYCNVFVTENLSDAANKKKIQQHLNVIAINMWGDREVTNFDGKRYNEKQFAIKHRVQFTPTVLFFDEKGGEVLRLNGYIPMDVFVHVLNYVIEKKDKTISYPAYMAAQHQPRTGSLIAEPDLFMAPPYLLLRHAQAKPLAVLFETPDCTYCATLHQKVLVDPESRKLLKHMDVVQLNAQADTPVLTPQGEKLTAKQWAEKLAVSFMPTLVFFDATGKEVIRSEAVFKIFHTQSIIDYVHSGAYQTEPEFQRYLSKRAEHIQAQGKDVDIWQ